MDLTVFELFGYSVSVGIVASMFTEVIKWTESVPFFSKIPAFQKILNVITKGNAKQIRTFVALLCLAANVGVYYYNTGMIPAVPMLLGSFNSFLAALGTYNFIFTQKKADK